MFFLSSSCYFSHDSWRTPRASHSLFFVSVPCDTLADTYWPLLPLCTCAFHLRVLYFGCHLDVCVYFIKHRFVESQHPCLSYPFTSTSLFSVLFFNMHMHPRAIFATLDLCSNCALYAPSTSFSRFSAQQVVRVDYMMFFSFFMCRQIIFIISLEPVARGLANRVHALRQLQYDFPRALEYHNATWFHSSRRTLPMT